MASQFEDIKIECKENCRNSPKKQLLKDFQIAFVKQDYSFCFEWMRDDISWHWIGDQHIQGKDKFKKVLEQFVDRNVKELHIHHIITHGNTASLNGTIILHAKQRIEFCDIYHFGGFGKNAKIKEITSYVIKTS